MARRSVGSGLRLLCAYTVPWSICISDSTRAFSLAVPTGGTPKKRNENNVLGCAQYFVWQMGPLLRRTLSSLHLLDSLKKERNRDTHTVHIQQGPPWLTPPPNTPSPPRLQRKQWVPTLNWLGLVQNLPGLMSSFHRTIFRSSMSTLLKSNSLHALSLSPSPPFPISKLQKCSQSSVVQSDHVLQLLIPLPQSLAFHRTFGRIRIGRSHLVIRNSLALIQRLEPGDPSLKINPTTACTALLANAPLAEIASSTR
ncbi:hypothetical protein BGZ63DRAFT_158574 [Mariannaea sp. PMI_226]|nr:hypothetical protein BGZ63DRAFT_158574 [Mariannaea sp. PMI_226]